MVHCCLYNMAGRIFNKGSINASVTKHKRIASLVARAKLRHFLASPIISSPVQNKSLPKSRVQIKNLQKLPIVQSCRPFNTRYNLRRDALTIQTNRKANTKTPIRVIEGIEDKKESIPCHPKNLKRKQPDSEIPRPRKYMKTRSRVNLDQSSESTQNSSRFSSGSQFPRLQTPNNLSNLSSLVSLESSFRHTSSTSRDSESSSGSISGAIPKKPLRMTSNQSPNQTGCLDTDETLHDTSVVTSGNENSVHSNDLHISDSRNFDILNSASSSSTSEDLPEDCTSSIGPPTTRAKSKQIRRQLRSCRNISELQNLGSPSVVASFASQPGLSLCDEDVTSTCVKSLEKLSTLDAPNLSCNSITTSDNCCDTVDDELISSSILANSIEISEVEGVDAKSAGDGLNLSEESDLCLNLFEENEEIPVLVLNENDFGDNFLLSRKQSVRSGSEIVSEDSFKVDPNELDLSLNVNSTIPSLCPTSHEDPLQSSSGYDSNQNSRPQSVELADRIDLNDEVSSTSSRNTPIESELVNSTLIENADIPSVSRVQETVVNTVESSALVHSCAVTTANPVSRTSSSVEDAVGRSNSPVSTDAILDRNVELIGTRRRTLTNQTSNPPSSSSQTSSSPSYPHISIPTYTPSPVAGSENIVHSQGNPSIRNNWIPGPSTSSAAGSLPIPNVAHRDHAPYWQHGNYFQPWASPSQSAYHHHYMPSDPFLWSSLSPSSWYYSSPEAWIPAASGWANDYPVSVST